MRLTGRMQIQLALFTVIALIAMSLMALHFMKLPAMLFGVGRYTVTVELPQTGGLYAGGNVTYRGTEVGRVDSVRLTQNRRGSGPLTQVRYRRAIRSAGRGAQPVGDRRAVRGAVAAERRCAAPA